MSRAATQLAGDAGSIFQAWLDLNQQPRIIRHGKAGKKSTSSRRPRRTNAP
jgi:hypothetical protein